MMEIESVILPINQPNHTFLKRYVWTVEVRHTPYLNYLYVFICVFFKKLWRRSDLQKILTRIAFLFPLMMSRALIAAFKTLTQNHLKPMLFSLNAYAFCACIF